MSNYSSGHHAETVAAEHLKKLKYKIIALNWKTPVCEVDIIARRKHGPVTFFEVKHRLTTAQGRGLDYITPQKVGQMHYAAEVWLQQNRLDADYELGAIELTGDDYEVTAVLERLT